MTANLRTARRRPAAALLGVMAAALLGASMVTTPPAAASSAATPLSAAVAAPGGPTRIPLQALPPLPAHPVVSAAARAARNRLLGGHWADPRYTTLNWVGVSSFIVTMHGHLLLFDAWQIIGGTDGYVPFTRQDLAALEPEAILVGHGHFDHAGDLGYVAGRTQGLVVSSDEVCGVASAGAQREGVGTNFRCAITGTANTPMGTMQRFRLFADLPPVTVLQHIHSAPKSPTSGGNPLDPNTPITNLQPYLDHPPANPADEARFLAQVKEENQGGTWIFQLTDGAFSLLLGDSAGPIKDQPAIRKALANFPGCVDVMANAILGFDAPVSGLADPVDYVDLVKPKIFLPDHADVWAPVISAGQSKYKTGLEARIRRLRNPPHVEYLLDPQDYLRERAYNVNDKQWKAPSPGSTCAAARTTGPAAVTPTTTPTAGTAHAGAGTAAPARGASRLAATGGPSGTMLLAGLITMAAGLLLVRQSPGVGADESQAAR